MKNKILLFSLALSFSVAAKPRARDLGIPFDGNPGPLNAITDVVNIEVGHVTLIKGSGKLKRGKGPVRTGVTAILPRGKSNLLPVFSGWYSLNGNGEMTGTPWLEESGYLEGPVMITNTYSVGIVRDAVVDWSVKLGKFEVGLPLVAETWDGDLNDARGFHVKEKHAFEALQNASGGKVEEGNVGGGTGMICFEFKCGIGTSSRRVKTTHGDYTVGVLVQGNFGLRDQLRIAGIPVGKEFPITSPATHENGSIIGIVATDAPLLPHQLRRLAKRASLGIGRLGAISGNGSGDLFLAFSTQTQKEAKKGLMNVSMIINDEMDPFFLATAEGIEEAVVNAMIAAETMKGINDHVVEAIPHDKLREILKRHNRLASKWASNGIYPLSYKKGNLVVKNVLGKLGTED